MTHSRILASLLAFLVVPLCVPVQSTPGAGVAETEFADLEWQVHEEVNRHRISQGLAPLAFHDGVAEIARSHSRAMAEQRLPFGHGGFDERAEAISRVVPFRALAENVATNNHPRQRTVSIAVQGLLQSSGHRQNIEGRFDVTGVGVARSAEGEFYFTQIFILKH